MAREGMENVEMIAGKKHAPKNLGRVLILGLGKSGTAAAEYCLDALGSRVETLAVAAGAPGEAALAWAEGARERGAVVLFDHETIEGAYDLCIASPGISENSPFYRSAAAASAEVISEVEFAWRESDASSKWVAITGTNGKTTTTALTCHLLREAGMNAAAVGNIGETCIDAVAAGNTDVYVAETSSYQLASTRLFAPDVAVVLNITPDHLSWHGSLEAYAAAKWKVLANLGVSGGVAVLDACDDAVRAKIRELRARGGVPFRYIPIGGAFGLGADMCATCGTGAAAFRGDGGQLVVAWDGRVSDLVFVDDLQIKGGHHQQNALAAAAAAHCLGVAPEVICSTLGKFTGVHRRFEVLGKFEGVTVADDFAHHPTELTAVLTSAMKMGYRQVWAVFQPHTYSRTYNLLEDFAQALSIPDHLVMTEILAVREENKWGIHTSDLAAKVPGSVWFDSFEKIADYVMEQAQPGDLILTLGGGDIYKCANLIVEKYKARQL